ncbi:XapX domain-containing protein [Sphingomonas echinoides]|uniref:XapX domain-containing protein n=1 Tax=Sphingomonas echinoides TaxID=59803 RepID=A0ABU4PJ98_9SPHN|nr:XapX domain-containing protein [Sphingomonas echinoides]MDX5984273.1 XapX domain-containing protein [Sphingomonas echinoides]
MKPYLISLAVGLLVGLIYSLLGVRSPAPPAIALVGLLGILVGEQMVPLVKRVSSGEAVAFLRAEAAEHVFGRLPGDHLDKDA